MQATWMKWQTRRRGMGKVKDWAGLFASQAEFLGRFPEADALEILEQSMRNGWQGLFELKNHANVRTSSQINTRLVGVHRGNGTDYGEAAARRIAMGRKVVEAEHQTPPEAGNTAGRGDSVLQ